MTMLIVAAMVSYPLYKIQLEKLLTEGNFFVHLGLTNLLN